MELGKCWLNPEPTDVQLATYARHKRAGTTPGNPKWYKPTKAPTPFRFVPGMAPVYLRLPSGADWNTGHDPMSAKVRGVSVETRYVES
jgi:hypothetical protein